MAFDGYSAEALQFLTTLGGQDKTWFHKHQTLYDTEVVAPTKAFVLALGDACASTISSSLVAQPRANGSIAPINNDIRFAQDKSPYKDHLLLRFWDGVDKKLAPTLFVRVSERSVGFATGVVFGSVDRWRSLIGHDATGEPFARALTQLGRGRDLDVAGQALKNVPKPFAADHPRASLLRYKSFQARWTEPTPASVQSAEFVDWCMSRLRACAPVHRWLKEHTP